MTLHSSLFLTYPRAINSPCVPVRMLPRNAHINVDPRSGVQAPTAPPYRRSRSGCARLKEESHAQLHHPLSGLAVDAAERWRVGIGDNFSIHRVVEKVQRFEMRLKISRLVV